MESTPLTRHAFYHLAILFEGGVALLGIVLGWFCGYPPGKLIQWSWEAVGQGLVATVPLVVLLAVFLKAPLRSFQVITRLLDEFLAPLFGGGGLLELIVLCGLAGLGEELLFRGVIQTGLTDWLPARWGLALGLLAASVLFGLAHAITPTYAVLAGLIGLYLGWLWIHTQNLLVPIVAHGVYDFVVLSYWIRIRGPRLLKS